MRVKNAMHKGVTCLESNAPISEIEKCMRDADIGAIPIKERGQVVVSRPVYPISGRGSRVRSVRSGVSW